MLKNGTLHFIPFFAFYTLIHTHIERLDSLCGKEVMDNPKHKVKMSYHINLI